MSQNQTQQLTAIYNSPSTTNKVFTGNLPAQPLEGATAEKTAYLNALRSGISQMQDEINVFLTVQMASEKASIGGSNTTATAQERKEEDFYGEVDPEDDEG